MNHCAKHILGVGWLACLLLVLSVTSCTDLIFDSREGCERGVYVNFKYDYNLYRADMFADHVGEVTLYVFDEQGNYITQCTEANEEGNEPLKKADYAMFLDLPEGTYRFIALAHQRKYDDLIQEEGAKFRRTEMNENNVKEDLKITLDHISTYEGEAYLR